MMTHRVLYRECDLIHWILCRSNVYEIHTFSFGNALREKVMHEMNVHVNANV